VGLPAFTDIVAAHAEMSSLSSPDAPAPPPQLSFGQNTYLSVGLSLDAPSTSGLTRRDGPPILTDPVPVSYVAPVGALADEHIYQVVGLDQASPRWAEVEKDVLAALKGVDGIKRVSVMDPPKQRFKRGGGDF
jgi:hypothetical protein